jgi:DNA-binding transcriptional ArsR family regulator
MKLPFDFYGFQSPRYTMVPDEIFDRLLPYLSPSELKVLLYLVRRTFGFKKDSDSISLSQICNGIRRKDGKIIDNGTGLSRPAVIKALRVLEDNNIIITYRSKNYKGEKQTNTYSLNVILGVGKTFNYPSKKHLTTLGKNLNIQETVLQDIDNNVKVTQYPKKPEYEIKDLINQMEQELQDNHSRAFYKKIAERHPSEIIYQALSITKDMDHQKQIKKSKAGFFTGLIQKMAKENGIKTV